MRPLSPIVRSLSDIENFLGIESCNAQVNISGITSDSRNVQAGDLFLALQGVGQNSQHGGTFAQQAIANGAVAILSDGKFDSADLKVPVVTMPNLPMFVGDLTSWFYSHPSRSMLTVGITGTNGKTTTASLLSQLWKLADRESGCIGTLGVDIGNEHFAGTHTTPEATHIQSILACMAERHITHAVMEVSSHALAQHRVSGTRFSLVGFSNLSQDHLDFHQTMEQYFAAKAKLFTVEFADRGFINIDDAHGLKLSEISEIPVVSLSRFNSSATWHYVRAELARSGFDISIRGAGGILIEGFLPLVGAHNLDNALMAIAMAVESGVDPLLIAARLHEIRGIPGRLEKIELGQAFTAVVDFAHSPDSVSQVLATLRVSTPGKLIAVLGCGGDRDKTKRPLMGSALIDGSDIAIFTSDNPRSENPEEILKDMTRSLSLPQSSLIELDRRTAIARAVELAEPGDCVAILGKGHESGQEINGVKNPFDDRLELAEAIGGHK